MRDVPCGQALRRSFYDADGTLIRQDCAIVVKPGLFGVISSIGDA
jgi:hypothetical protein